MFGLIESDMQYIKSALEKFEEIECGIIFGSRAMGNYKKGSDVDLAVKGKNITSNTINKVFDLLNEEYPLPYFFDVIHYETIANANLKAHIDNEGEAIYAVDSAGNQ